MSFLECKLDALECTRVKLGRNASELGLFALSECRLQEGGATSFDVVGQDAQVERFLVNLDE